MAAEDRVTPKQEQKLSAADVSPVDEDRGDYVVIVERVATPRVAPSPIPEGQPSSLRPIAALVADQDEKVHLKERKVSAKKGDMLSNIEGSNTLSGFLLGGMSGRTVAKTQAYIEAELEGSESGPVALTVWENERRTYLPHHLTLGQGGFSAKNLTIVERKQWTDGAGAPKASPHTEDADQRVPEWVLPDGWVWQGNWKVVQPREKDADGADPDRAGWQYSFNWGNAWFNTCKSGTHVRRRRWGRVRVPTEDVRVLRERNRAKKKQEAQRKTQKRRSDQLKNAATVIDGTVRGALTAQGALDAFKTLHFKEGYIYKRGSLRRNWLRRWFVLNEGVLQYYAAEADIKKHKEGFWRYANQIVLDESCTCVNSDEPHPLDESRRCIELRTWNRAPLLMYTELDEDQEAWKAYLNFALDGIRQALATADPPIKRGPLYKRGEWGKWTRRWFVVNGGSFPRLVYCSYKRTSFHWSATILTCGRLCSQINRRSMRSRTASPSASLTCEAPSSPLRRRHSPRRRLSTLVAPNPWRPASFLTLSSVLQHRSSAGLAQPSCRTWCRTGTTSVTGGSSSRSVPSSGHSPSALKISRTLTSG